MTIIAVLFIVAALRARSLVMRALQDPERLRSLLEGLLASDLLNAEQKQKLAAYLERWQEQGGGPEGNPIQALPPGIARLLGLPHGTAAHPVGAPGRRLPTRPPALFESSGSALRPVLAIAVGAAVAAALGYWAQ
jgi:hypothetical protein